MVCGFGAVSDYKWPFGKYPSSASFLLSHHLTNFLTSPKIFHHTDISLIKQRQLVSSQILIGLGAGMVWIGLIVGIQASCRRHSDVAISIGLLTTFNALGEMVAEAMKRLMQTYLLNLLPSDSSQEDFIRALNGHWGIMLLVAIAAAAFALLMSCVGLPNVSFILDLHRRCIESKQEL